MSRLEFKGTRVDYHTAKERVLAYLYSQWQADRMQLSGAATIGSMIWPDCEMRAQGLGGAASRILKRMATENPPLVTWATDRYGWGYRLTFDGVKAAAMITMPI
jgi:hypothetical protein